MDCRLHEDLGQRDLEMFLEMKLPGVSWAQLGQNVGGGIWMRHKETRVWWGWEWGGGLRSRGEAVIRA